MRPQITIGIISYNRYHYLRALINSLLECVPMHDTELILVDNASSEPQLKEYIESLNFCTCRIVEPCTMAWALNKIIELSSSDIVAILSDDIQFILKGTNWIAGCCNLLRKYEHIGSIIFDAQRRVTVKRYFGGWKKRLYQKRYHDSKTGIEFFSYGKGKIGVAPAGINSITRKEIWHKLGLWRSEEGTSGLIDSSMGAEDAMILRYRRSQLKLERCVLKLPVAADIITDSGGFAAKVRKGTRYGEYYPPPNGHLYYSILDLHEAEHLKSIRPMPSFEDMVQPVGFSLPFDENGNLMKGNPTFK